MLDVLLDALIDTAKLIPFLFIANHSQLDWPRLTRGILTEPHKLHHQEFFRRGCLLTADQRIPDVLLNDDAVGFSEIKKHGLILGRTVQPIDAISNQILSFCGGVSENVINSIAALVC